MTTNQSKIDQLLIKLETLSIRQENFSKEINDLRMEINRQRTIAEKQPIEKESVKQNNKSKIDTNLEPDIEKATSYGENILIQNQELQKAATPPSPVNKPHKTESNFEKFIGENLINKIGITITVIGIAIGTKYSIEHELISPLTRIILGYLTGIGLLGFGMKLKKKYENFSAVLVSGAIATMYFITYAACSFYELIPQIMAFLLMIAFTAFTVVAAINYNRQIIAHIGLVGAYAVPFLLDDGAGQVTILFTYMTIINIGILVIALKRYWKPLYYSSFGLTWVIFYIWYVTNYTICKDFSTALTFLIIFFVIFYLTFLSYKLLLKEKFYIENIIMLLTNSFIFYGIGYSILNNQRTGEQLLGLFTLCNAIVHFIVSVIIYKQKLADRNLFLLVSGLVLVFITIAIPVQLDGNWVTLLWAGEAALLFWIGRTKNISVYEKLSFPLMILAFFSIAHDWTTLYGVYYPKNTETRLTPLFNTNFLSSCLFIAVFSFINILSQNKKNISSLESQKTISKIISFMIPTILIFTIYCTFYLEIANYWDQLFKDSLLTIKLKNQLHLNQYSNCDLFNFKVVWIINYTLLFVSSLAFVNFRRLKNKLFGLINLSLLTLAIVVFLVLGLYTLGKLRESYLEQILSQYYHRGAFNLGIRYISFAFVSLALVTCYRYIKKEFMDVNLRIAFDFILHITVLFIASSEIINWLEITNFSNSYKLGLSILWGIYSLFIIVLGIWKKKKYLRIGGISLFGITLLKLFFYDISHLDTIAKTIILVSLGVLLLIISFLYNKYKHIISNETHD